MEYAERYQPETKKATLSDKLDYMATAHFFTRFVSYIIDVILIWAMSQILIYPVLGMLGVKDLQFWLPIFSLDNILSGLLFFSYFVLMTYFLSQTLGKMITGISVVDKDKKKLTFPQVIYRELVGRFINNTLIYIPYLMIIFTENRIGLHDFFADTYVVKNNYQEYNHMIKDRYFKEIDNSQYTYQQDG